VSKAKITIYGSHAKLTGDYNKYRVREVTSYPVQGYQFSKAFQRGKWDGRKHLFRPRSGAFPSGLTGALRRSLEEEGVEVELEDLRPEPRPGGHGFDLKGIDFEPPYEYQEAACQLMVTHKQGIVKVATGGGKCLGPETPVLKYDGTVILADQVKPGDLLMGPDSKPRKVLSTCTGWSDIYKIVPNKGEPFRCNDVHVLTLRHTQTGEVIDIGLDEYQKQNQTFKHCHKLFRVGTEFEEREVLLDPYFVGLWIGDGRKDLSQGIQITNIDDEIVSFLKEFAKSQDCGLSEYIYPDRCPTYGIVTPRGKINPVLDSMRELFPKTRIPRDYLINSRDRRLQLLAGIVDSDGYWSGKNIDLVQSRKELAEDIVFLARSLGYHSSLGDKIINGETYWRVYISGDTLSEIPVRLERKKPRDIIGRKATNTGFAVEHEGPGLYVGWTLDVDGRFLLGDFTVTHNTEIACAVTKYLGLKTLFLVPSRELMYQSQKRFIKRLELSEDEVGIVGDGKWQPGSFVTVASIQTLEARMNTPEAQHLIESAEVLFLDECHGVGSDTYYTVATLCPAYYRYGLSATPLDRTDGANLMLIAATGEMLIDIPLKELVERGINPGADIIFDKVTEPVLKKNCRYPTAYKKGVSENEQLLDKVVEWAEIFANQGLNVLILCEEIQHGKTIDEALWNKPSKMIPHQFIHGTEDTDIRQGALESFSKRRLPVLIASTILDQGVDTDAIDALILAGSRKSKIKTLQRLGRGLRGKKLIVVEFSNFCHKYLLEHSYQRLCDYKNEECFPIHSSGPDAELVRKLWNDQD